MSGVVGRIRQAVGGSSFTRPMVRHLPASDRCKECAIPFTGPFSLPFQMVAIRRSRKNPHMCTLCYEYAPPGGEVHAVTVLFVDVRGFTTLSEQMGPAELAARLNRFYWLATDAVFRFDGTLDKLVGDEVMAFFGSPFHVDDHPHRAVSAARAILEGMAQQEPSLHLPVGAGIATGEAFVGNVGRDDVKDFTVLGDVVNTAARLQAEAAPGELIMTEETYAHVSKEFPDAEPRTLELKGKSRPVGVRSAKLW
ncbi:MAG: adenylate/guanylate cyclase domain-containing protein [Chloroflexota bacterium]